MKLVVGLGNSGRKYEHTRHNVGFDVVDEVARRVGAVFRRSWRFPADLAEATVAGERVLLVKPRTFMNRSGEAVGPLARKKGVTPADVLVVVDDVELDCGRLRLRRGGSAGGHNGLKSVIEIMGSDVFPRVRVGVGRTPEGGDMVQHVLGRFSPADREAVEQAVERAADAVEMVVREGLDKAQNKFNG
jgi:PTH1 family peptidyl-tRNA hydrolase